MNSPLLPPAELRERGFAALVAALGWANAVRFIQQYETSRLDYTKEREWMLPNWDLETWIGKIQERQDRAP